jgi:hypothetical protein
MKNIIIMLGLCLIIFSAQAQEFDLKNFLQQNNIDETILNTAPELNLERPTDDSIKNYRKRMNMGTIAVMGYPIPVDLNLREKMKWVETPNGLSIGILKIKCAGVKSLSPTFTFNNLPEGLEIYFTNQDMSKSDFFKEQSMQFMRVHEFKEAFLGELKGDFSYLIVILPTSDKRNLDMKIKGVAYGFSSLQENSRSPTGL